ncbi:2-oxoglutarate and iron-dependent oxygenase domain-containing protein 3-like [Clytia hemisphaerica]|uniref:Fe2OG dioxygenase domain-containing protein n=1 Tax=Clytia hemisphaerica TaxID=252671 RepID=A0A7M5XHU3_9CNID
MSNVRKRNVKFAAGTKEEDGKGPSGLQKVGSAVLNVILNRKKNKGRIQKIENASIWPYLFLFVIFLTFSIYFVDYLHRWENNELLNDAYQTESYEKRFVEVKCSNDYGKSFKNCKPKKCGRAVRDNLFTLEDIKHMREIAIKGMQYGGGNGGATILDLHSGALSKGDKFINLHAASESSVFNKSDFEVYSKIRNKIQETIADEFNVDKKVLHLTKPTFFSRLDNKSASTQHDEYWHEHVDRVTYGTFYYTSLLYLSDYGVDFTGGRFMFVDGHTNKSVEPKFGRLSFFTSGSENIHFVERVENGTRYAITVSFTCDKKHKIVDPSM